MKRNLLASALLLCSGLVQAASIDVYRDPNCGCCHAWIEHLQENGFEVTDHVTANVVTLKQQLGISPDLRSCHTRVEALQVLPSPIQLFRAQRQL